MDRYNINGEPIHVAVCRHCYNCVNVGNILLSEVPGIKTKHEEIITNVPNWLFLLDAISNCCDKPNYNYWE